MSDIVLLKHKGKDLQFKMQLVLNAGFAGRDRKVALHHVDELAKLGVPVPKRIPTVYPVSENLVSPRKNIQVQHGETSGEIEYVLLFVDGKIFVTVGSDHSDRKIEQYDIATAKQAYFNIVAEEVWDYDEIKDHWDECILRCRIYNDNEWVIYQEDPVSEIVTPEELIKITNELTENKTEGLVLFSGTVPTKKGLIFGEKYQIELEDPVTNKKIVHEYVVEILPPAIQ